LKLNNDQTKLILELSKFWNDPNRQYFVLSGQAGVGKTTCMRFFKDHLKVVEPGINICMSAPTNKATAVLSDSVSDPDLTYKTIYSILGLRMQANGEFKELTDSGEERISDFDLVIVDEASMINTNLRKRIIYLTPRLSSLAIENSYPLLVKLSVQSGQCSRSTMSSLK